MVTKAEKKLVESLSRRVRRSLSDSRLVKFLDRITRFSLTAEIRLYGHEISPVFTFVILVLGIVFSIRLVYKYIARPIVYPILRHFFYRIIRHRSRLLPPVSNLH